jgi:hypothetical protein
VDAPKVDLEQYKNDLSELYLQGVTANDLVQYLEIWHGISIHRNTMKRRLKDWRIRQRISPPEVSTQLKQRIQVLFFQIGLSDFEILQVLQQEGFQTVMEPDRTGPNFG